MKFSNLNVEKTCKVSYGNKNPNNTYFITQNNIKKQIKSCESVKDLGITFDKELKFRQHISNCINKGNQITGLVRRSFLHVKKKPFKKLYKTLIRPHLEYGNIIWNPRFKKDIDAIERVQRRATKLVGSVRNLPYSERLKALNLPTLAYRRFRGDMIQTYKILNGKEDIEYTRFFEFNNQATRSNGQKLEVKTSNKDIRKNFYSVRVPKEWNNLSADIVNAPTQDTFKNRLDKFMKNKIYTVHPENAWVNNHDGVT